MKSLQQLNNVERGKLIFELFPELIPGFVAYATDVTANFDETHLRETWNNPMIGVDWWIGLLQTVQGILVKYGSSISKSKNLFSDQLFDGYNALITTTLLSNYAREETTPAKLSTAIKLLFEF